MGRVVVGVDGSHNSRGALAWAIREAGRRGATLVPVHVASPPRSLHGEPLLSDAEAYAAAETVINEALAAVSEAPAEVRVEPRARVTRGSVARCLLDETRAEDVLVVGARGIGGFMALLAGSVSLQCAAHARCPVVVVPPEDDEEAGAGAGPHESPAYVVGVDGSPESRAALRWAVEEALLWAGDVEAVFAFEPATVSAYPPAAVEVAIDPRAREAARTASAQVLEEALVEVSADGPALTSTVVDGAPAGVLVDRSKTADLLVVGSRGRGGFLGLLLGSVSQQCVQHAHCPVVVLPARS